MSLPSRDPRKCAALSQEELEDTFFYPGPVPVSKPPGDLPLGHWQKAKDVCGGCPLLSRCRATSWGEEFGIWGGTDQYERHLHRRALNRRLSAMSEAKRAQLAASLYRQRGATGWRVRAIARETGYSPEAVRLLVTEHVARLKAEREAAGQAARDAVGWTGGADGEAAA